MRRSPISLRLSVAILVLAALPVLGGWWAWKGQGPLRQEATVLVKKGTSINQMADQLEREGVIRSASLFKLWARARKLQLIRGEYTFKSQASLSEVAGKLRRAEIHYTTVSIPEGAHAWAVQRRLKDFVPEEIFWTLWKSPRLVRTAGFERAESLEGLVAPATYRLHHAMEPEEVMLMLVEAFRDQVRPRLDGGVLPPYETLILASLVEKETKLAEEQPRVAGVYKKRLDIGMRLQCDPTSLYARWLLGDLRFTAPLVEDIRRSHRFNTYAVAGLPPTPIAIPSPAAIAAARAPLVGKDLYFVATGKGGHSFAPSLRDHNRNVGVYRQEIARQKKLARG
ncbi:MAG: endolytic transglycosylase MltG [Geothrix sp.]|uniref:Endolytic murein transglycosylase n=1 Tax=Candidatus Geothrix odensensis TaxID=2954440 RepID=A0A936K5D5_9BACT|nr:endolytic transglycosylase MltG [Candidatus Geothrix odensensis]MCC6513627.1 endolytic transglycosylase MltG [Geothrix sp.]